MIGFTPQKDGVLKSYLAVNLSIRTAGEVGGVDLVGAGLAGGAAPVEEALVRHEFFRLVHCAAAAGAT